MIFVILPEGLAISSSAELGGSPWVSKAPVPSSGSGIKAGVVNDSIYAFRSNVTYEYDLTTWSTRKQMPSPRYDFAVATYQNKIYCMGGKDTKSTPLATNEVYNPASDSWESLAAMPTPRHGLEANVVNGKIYLISGLVHARMSDVKGTFELTNINEVYDPATNRWATKTPIPYPASYYASAVVNNKIYIISSLTQIYDPQTDTWNYGEPTPFPVDMAGGATVVGVSPQRVYIIGGRDSAHLLETAYNQIYNPANDSWILGTPMPTSRYGLTTAVVDNKIYAIGGTTGVFHTVAGTDITEQYYPLKDSAAPSVPSTVPSPSTQKPKFEPYQTVLFATAVVAIAVVTCAGLFVYFKNKRKVNV